MAFGYLAPLDRPRHALFTDADYARQRAFFAAHPELRPTPLRSLRSLSRTLSVGAIHVKDESSRFGLNAFKAAGALFAVTTLRERGELAADAVVACASEGNHGRAVARAAREAGCRARVYVAASVAACRVEAIESEGATVVRVDGSYDDAVRAMMRDARANAWQVISDHALPGDPIEVPRLIMLGYTRLMDEARAQWEPGPPPDVIFVPGGVGGLLAAITDWTDHAAIDPRPTIVCVEPATAACLQVSAREGRPTTLAGPLDTVMAGLRCGEVSRAGFDTVLAGVGAYVAIDDRWALDAMRQLAAGAGGDPIIQTGASGAAALGGLLAMLRDPGLSDLRTALGVGRGSRMLLLLSEGVTDPDMFASVVGRPINEHSGPISREP